MTNQPRPVWFTEAEMLLDVGALYHLLRQRHMMAPADSVGVLAVAQYRRRWPDDQDLKQYGDGRAWRAAARAHLALLGMPHA